MANYVFDTSFISHNKLPVLSGNSFLSDVVILEFMGSATDTNDFNKYKLARDIAAEDGTLITPTPDDWLMSSKILFWLEQGKRRKNKGMAPPKRPGGTQRMALDTLIATSARRNSLTVVTENWDDFNAIKYYCDFKLMRGAEYLAKFSK